MKSGCPYFEIQKTADYENFAEIITADRQPKHFIRRRAYASAKNSDINGVMRDFNYIGVGHKDGTFIKPLTAVGVFSALTLTASGIFVAYAENIVDGLAIYLTAPLLLALFGVFLYCHLKELSFVKSVAHLFIFYNSKGQPYSVEIQGKRIRVLYNGKLFAINRGKAREVKSMRLRYYAYLNIYPQSIFDMGKFLDNSDKSYSAVLVPQVTFTDDGSGFLALDCRHINHDGASPIYKDKHTQFTKYIFEVNGDLKLNAVYSAARENAVIDDKILTKAEVISRGQAAEDDLKPYIFRNKALEKILKEIE